MRARNTAPALLMAPGAWWPHPPASHPHAHAQVVPATYAQLLPLCSLEAMCLSVLSKQAMSHFDAGKGARQARAWAALWRRWRVGSATQHVNNVGVLRDCLRAIDTCCAAPRGAPTCCAAARRQAGHVCRCGAAQRAAEVTPGWHGCASTGAAVVRCTPRGGLARRTLAIAACSCADSWLGKPCIAARCCNTDACILARLLPCP